MRKALCLPLILGWFCFPVSAQTKEACLEQLRHFTVPEYQRAFSTVTHDGSVKLPGRLLFSQDGIEVYAATFPDGRQPFLDQVSVNGMEVLFVYQDEAARQAMVKELREKQALPPPGMGALVDNLKYAVIHFLPESLIPGKPFAEKWQVGHIEYDQPRQCLNVFQNDLHTTPFDANTHSTSIISETNPPWINQRLPVGRYPLWSKALEAMLAWVKECASLAGG